MSIYNFVSFIGIFVLLAFAWSISADRRNMNWRLIAWGVGLQLLFGLFVFGRLALAPGKINADGEVSVGFILMFQAFPAIVFFSALMSILYFYRVLPFIIRGFAYVFTKLMRISGAESLLRLCIFQALRGNRASSCRRRLRWSSLRDMILMKSNISFLPMACWAVLKKAS